MWPENVRSPQLYVPDLPSPTPSTVIRNNMSLTVFGWSLGMFGLLGRQCLADPGSVVDMYVRKRSVLPMAIIMPHRRMMFTAYSAGGRVGRGTKDIAHAPMSTTCRTHIGLSVK